MMDKYRSCFTGYKFLDENFTSLAEKCASGSGIKNDNMSKKELVEQLQKTVIGKF